MSNVKERRRYNQTITGQNTPPQKRLVTTSLNHPCRSSLSPHQLSSPFLLRGVRPKHVHGEKEGEERKKIMPMHITPLQETSQAPSPEPVWVRGKTRTIPLIWVA
ncbi:hypothetical protein TNCV_201971 [Trichonephila clavipes]|nr:hypothetical protein TNCV_201971 [Trichonephila clavipes]